MKLPSVSFIIPALNSGKILDACLNAIRTQDYPQQLVEILVLDGGSTDSTQEIAAKYNARFIKGGYKNNMEARRSVGLSAAKNDLIGIIDTDNILLSADWLAQMVAPFLDHPKVVASQTWRYAVKPEASAFNRYCALLGANDPVAYYLGKADKISWIYDKWTGGEVLEDNEHYTLVNFDENSLPTAGSNGFLIKRDILLQLQCPPEEFFHIDLVMDLVRKGYKTFAMVKNELYHATAANLFKLVSRRISYFMIHNPLQSNRRYLIFNPKRPKDIFNLLKFIIFTVTFVEPVLFSVRGYLKKKDTAWFLHPIVCWSFLISYAVATIGLGVQELLSKIGKK